MVNSLKSIYSNYVDFRVLELTVGDLMTKIIQNGVSVEGNILVVQRSVIFIFVCTKTRKETQLEF